jgi:hypothetical protein
MMPAATERTRGKKRAAAIAALVLAPFVLVVSCNLNPRPDTPDLAGGNDNMGGHSAGYASGGNPSTDIPGQGNGGSPVVGGGQDAGVPPPAVSSDSGADSGDAGTADAADGAVE